MDKTIIAPAVEDKNTETVTEAVVESVATEDTKKEETIGEALGTETKKEARLVPEAALIEYKKENKELVKEIRELKKSIESGATKKEVSSDLKALAEEYGVDENFLSKLVSVTQAEAEAKLSSKLQPLEDEKKAEKIEKIFNENFDKALEDMPEFKGIANRDVIKSLCLDPKNSNKTFAKILEESYGHLVTGKRTIESTKPRGGAGDATIDFDKAKKDTSYFTEIMSNPELKKKYNEELVKRINL